MKEEKKFWNKEYKNSEHLKLSENPSEELAFFANWIEKELGKGAISMMNILDVGCGNGRNLAYLNEEYRGKGTGFDISEEAINIAKKNYKDKKNISFFVKDIRENMEMENESVDLILDLMVSHHLTKEEHKKYFGEVLRVMKKDGWLLWKTFLLDDDVHAKKMIRESKSQGLDKKDNGYIHPEFGFYEYVWSEEEIREYVEPYFKIHTIRRSQAHKGKGYHKRRYMVLYLERKQ